MNCGSENESGFSEDQIRFISEFVLLENYPDAQIIESKIQDGLEINKEGQLVFTTNLYMKAKTITSQSITIDLKLYRE